MSIYRWQARNMARQLGLSTANVQHGPPAWSVHGQRAAWPASLVCPRPACSMARQLGLSTASVQHGPPAWSVHGQRAAWPASLVCPWPASLVCPRPACSMARQLGLSMARQLGLSTATWIPSYWRDTKWFNLNVMTNLKVWIAQ